MKRNKRLGIIIDELTNNPCKLYESKYFCDRLDIAKSSLSEDIALANEVFTENGTGKIDSTSGTHGGFKYVPGISQEKIKNLQDELCEKLSDADRIVGGGFLYTSDIMFDGDLVSNMARVFVQKFYELDADYIVTVETKGIPLAAQVAKMLNLPLVVIRREARYSEGSTVSINFFSGSSDRIQKMSIAKRAVEPGKKAIIIDDFMRAGGSMKGIQEILAEFDVETVGMGVAVVAKEPQKKKVEKYISIVLLDSIDESKNKIKITPNNDI